MKQDFLKAKRGQNTSEYLILLVLLAVGGVGMWSVFGQSMKNQVSNSIAALEGKSDQIQVFDATKEGQDRMKKGTGMQLDKDALKKFEK